MEIILYSEDRLFAERFAWLRNQAGLPQHHVRRSPFGSDAQAGRADIHFFHYRTLDGDCDALAGTRSRQPEARIVLVVDDSVPDLDRECKSLDADDVLRTSELTPALLKGIFRQTQRANRHIESLKHQVNRYRGFFEWSKDCLFYVETGASGDFRYTDINPTALLCLGLSADQVRGRTPQEILGPEGGERVALAMGFARQQGKPYHFSTTLNHGHGERLYDATYIPYSNGGGNIEGILGSARDVTELKRAQLRLSELETLRDLPPDKERDTQFAAIVTSSADAIVSSNAEGLVATWNPGAERLFGYSVQETIGKSPLDLIVPATLSDEFQALRASLCSERRAIVKDTVRRHKDGTLIDVEINVSPIVYDDKVKGTAVVYRDVSERKRFERRQLMLMSELSHRGKNLFSVVHSIARLSLANADTVEAAKEALLGRLEALSRTYGRLTDAGFEGGHLKEILEAELSAFEGRAHSRGPEIILTARAAQTFALTIHELATNAAKYGALSVAGGHVDLTWTIQNAGGEPRVRFAWVESGGPKVAPPNRKGFGTTLITSIAAADFECSPEILYNENGVRYGFEARLSQLGTLVEASPVRRRLQSSTLIALYDHWAQHLGAHGVLPKYHHFDRTFFAADGTMTIASIDAQGDVHFLEVGHALIERLGRSIDNDDISSADPDSLAEAYRRCAKTGRPCYEHLRFDFGDGEAVNFERLLVPYSEDGARVTHLAGIAVFSGDTSSRGNG